MPAMQYRCAIVYLLTVEHPQDARGLLLVHHVYREWES